MSYQEHAPIAPSALARTVQCNAWYQMSLKIPPEPETEDQAEGKAAHWVAVMMAMGHKIEAGTIAPNGFTVDDEMIDGALMYVEALEGHPGIGEQQIPIRRIHADQCYGTPDFWQYSPVTRILRIIDYKYGHRYVEVFRIWQLMAYAAGVMDLLQLDDQTTTLQLMIVQPRWYHRDGPVREWTVGASVIRTFINDAHYAAAAALGPNPTAHTGDECGDCPVRAHCGTLHNAGGNIVDLAGAADLLQVTPADVGRELRILHQAAKRLEAKITGKEAQAMNLIRAGKNVPFFAIDFTRPHIKWTKPIEEIEALGLIYGKQLTKSKPITPKQAEALGIDGAVIEGYCQRPHGTAKLVPESLTQTSKVFS